MRLECLAYFERNKDQFSPPVIEKNDSNTSIDPKGEKGPVGPAEVNSTDVMVLQQKLSNLIF